MTAVCGLGLWACSPAPDATPAAAALHIRIAPLHDYAWRDRRGTGQPVDMKPAAEREALIRALVDGNEDLVVVRGLGSEAALQHLCDALNAAGCSYQPLYFPGPTVYQGLGLLFRDLALSPLSALNPTPYRIEEREYLPLFGGVKVPRPDKPPLWLVNARLPDPDAPYERRRNEARLLMQALREPVQQGQPVLLSIHSREEIDSPMMRMLTDTGLQRLPATDPRGDQWTHRDPEGVVYRQDQWLFASPALIDQMTTDAEVLDTPDLRTAGPYRHQRVQIP